MKHAIALRKAIEQHLATSIKHQVRGARDIGEAMLCLL